MSKRKCSVLDYACYREWRLIVNDIIPPIKTEILRLTQSLEYTITISKKVVKLLHIRIKSCAVHQLFQPVIGHFTQRYVWLWWQLIIIKAVNKIKQAHKTSVVVWGLSRRQRDKHRSCKWGQQAVAQRGLQREGEAWTPQEEATSPYTFLPSPSFCSPSTWGRSGFWGMRTLRYMEELFRMTAM